MRDLFPKDSGINEKRIAFIERVVSRLARRSAKTAKAMITPYPISNSVIGEAVSGDILKYMFPCSGVIKKGAVVLGERPKEGAVVGITIANDMGENYKSYVINRKNILVEPSLNVSAWDRLTVSISAIGESVVNEIWVSLLWVPDVKEVDVKTCLIEELEAELDNFKEE